MTTNSDSKSAGKMFPSYKNPPLMEVVSGVIFERLKGFKAPHAGLFWSRFLNEFPICEHAPPLDIEEGTGIDGLPLPRFWFLNEAGNNLIQLQDNRFHFNWRRTGESDEYPRYKAVIGSLKKYFSTFVEFSSEFSLGPLKLVRCELSYINHILKGAGWNSLAHLNDLFPDLGWKFHPDSFLGGPTSLGWQSSFSLPDGNGQLTVKIQYATRRNDQHPLLLLELSAQGLRSQNTLEAVWDWFDSAHDSVVQAFADLTGKSVQIEVWGRHDQNLEVK